MSFCEIILFGFLGPIIANHLSLHLFNQLNLCKDEKITIVCSSLGGVHFLMKSVQEIHKTSLFRLSMVVQQVIKVLRHHFVLLLLPRMTTSLLFRHKEMTTCWYSVMIQESWFIPRLFLQDQPRLFFLPHCRVTSRFASWPMHIIILAL